MWESSTKKYIKNNTEFLNFKMKNFKPLPLVCLQYLWVNSAGRVLVAVVVAGTGCASVRWWVTHRTQPTTVRYPPQVHSNYPQPLAGRYAGTIIKIKINIKNFIKKSSSWSPPPPEPRVKGKFLRFPIFV
jgi:hypothetical protein